MSSGGEVREVLAFWFGEPGSAGYGKPRPAWFRKDPDFDAQIRSRFLALHARAALGECERWRDDPDSLLALIVVLDQFSRNLYRDDPRAFSQDAAALDCARLMVERGWDAARLPVERQSSRRSRPSPKRRGSPSGPRSTASSCGASAAFRTATPPSGASPRPRRSRS